MTGQLQAEDARRASDLILEINLFSKQRLAMIKERPLLLAARALHMHGGEPPHPHAVGDRPGVIAIRLHRHRLSQTAKPPGIDTDHCQPSLAQA
jgi:hypothetical protein